MVVDSPLRGSRPWKILPLPLQQQQQNRLQNNVKYTIIHKKNVFHNICSDKPTHFDWINNYFILFFNSIKLHLCLYINL